MPTDDFLGLCAGHAHKVGHFQIFQTSRYGKFYCAACGQTGAGGGVLSKDSTCRGGIILGSEFSSQGQLGQLGHCLILGESHQQRNRVGLGTEADCDGDGRALVDGGACGQTLGDDLSFLYRVAVNLSLGDIDVDGFQFVGGLGVIQTGELGKGNLFCGGHRSGGFVDDGCLRCGFSRGGRSLGGRGGFHGSGGYGGICGGAGRIGHVVGRLSGGGSDGGRGGGIINLRIVGIISSDKLTDTPYRQNKEQEQDYNSTGHDQEAAEVFLFLGVVLLHVIGVEIIHGIGGGVEPAVGIGIRVIFFICGRGLGGSNVVRDKGGGSR